jgi:hypothetical protein
MTLSAEARAEGWGLRAFDDAGRLAVDMTVEA